MTLGGVSEDPPEAPPRIAAASRRSEWTTTRARHGVAWRTVDRQASGMSDPGLLAGDVGAG
jgi:hypothetical protein